MKKGLFYTILCIAIIICTTIITIILISKSTKFKLNYTNSKKEAISILNRNKEKISDIAKTVYNTKESINNPIDNITYVSYSDSNHINKEYIQFDIDTRGMLGGQYYGLIYSNDDIIDGNIKKIYHEKNGNNTFIYEKIEDNWYFYYFDYDGKTK